MSILRFSARGRYSGRWPRSLRISVIIDAGVARSALPIRIAHLHRSSISRSGRDDCRLMQVRCNATPAFLLINADTAPGHRLSSIWSLIIAGALKAARFRQPCRQGGRADATIQPKASDSHATLGPQHQARRRHQRPPMPVLKFLVPGERRDVDYIWRERRGDGGGQAAA